MAKIEVRQPAERPDVYYRPTAVLAENIGRDRTISAQSALISGRVQFSTIHLPAGLVVTSLTFTSGTAAVTPTNQWATLASLAMVKLAISADATTVAWGANADKTFTMTTPYVVPTTGLYLAGLCVVAGTVPSIQGVSSIGAVMNETPSLAGAGNGSLTDPASAPSTYASYTLIPSTTFLRVKVT